MSEQLTYDTIDTKKRDLIMVGLAIALFAACFDGTVTTTCGPVIGDQFNAQGALPWLTTGYLLLETVAIPLSGKLSDLYGRKKLLIIGLVLFGTASFLAAIAWDMWVVILARAIQGAGGGILIPVATAAVSDLYRPEDRGKVQGILGGLFGIGMGAGPLLGGYFASLGDLGFCHGWQLAFFINIPIVLAVIYLCRHEFPSMVVTEKPVIDYLGVGLISLALIGIVVYFQSVGKVFSIDSIASLVCIVAILIVFILFARVEREAKEPIMAPHIFLNPTVRSAAIIFFLLGFALVGDELFMGMYLQKVTDHSAMEAGFIILSMVIGMIISSVGSGMIINKTGTKPLVIAGTLTMAIGFFVLSGMQPTFNAVLIIGGEFLFGLGAGFLLSSLMTSVQNSCNHEEVGMTTSAVNLMRNVGSTVGTSIFTLIVTAAIHEGAMDNSLISKWASDGLNILNHLTDIGITQGEIDAIKSVFTDSVAIAFFIGSILLFVTVIIAFRFKVEKIEQTKAIAEFSEEMRKDNKKL